MNTVTFKALDADDLHDLIEAKMRRLQDLDERSAEWQRNYDRACEFANELPDAPTDTRYAQWAEA